MAVLYTKKDANSIDSYDIMYLGEYMLKAVIFDLDGTLIDTIKDIQIAVNVALKEHQFNEVSMEVVTQSIGSGAYQLIDLITNHASKDIQDQIYKTYQAYYDTHHTVYSRPYEGITELISMLSSLGIQLGVVSNKHHYLVENIIQTYFHSIHYYHGMKPNIPIKPHKAMIEVILENMKVSKEDVVFIGDSEPDIIASKSAGIDCIAVGYGYRSLEQLALLNPKYQVATVLELTNLLKERIHHD